ncbi:hypothetical protein ABZ485_27915 [Streptomyces albogriseolus]|uniref:hypothetical protein n=1 Tax=Streptomyces albogriseolus TaxID=1887 RepID=UPI0034605C65
MSAEPAHPGPDPRHKARVITFPMASRPPRHQRQETRLPADPLTPEERLAASVEKTFNEHGHTLTDETTAEIVTITLGIARDMLEGARRSEVIDDGQHAELDALYLGMLAAPGILGGE